MSDVIFIIGVNTHAYLLTKSNMADVGPIGKVIFFVSYTILTCNTSNVTNFGMKNSFLMLFHHWRSIHMLIYLPNPIWRPSAILEKSSSLFLTPFSRVIPLILLILVCRIHFRCYFIIGVNTHAYLLTKSNFGHIGIVIFVSYTIFTCSTSKVTNFGM